MLKVVSLMVFSSFPKWARASARKGCLAGRRLWRRPDKRDAGSLLKGGKSQLLVPLLFHLFLQQLEKFLHRINNTGLPEHLIAEQIAAGAEIDFRPFQQQIHGDQLLGGGEGGLALWISQVTP